MHVLVGICKMRNSVGDQAVVLTRIHHESDRRERALSAVQSAKQRVYIFGSAIVNSI